VCSTLHKSEAGESKTFAPRLPISEWARGNFQEQHLKKERKDADALRSKVADRNKIYNLSPRGILIRGLDEAGD